MVCGGVVAWQVATLTTSSEVVVVGAASPDPSSAPPQGCGVAIVDESTVAHMLLVGILDPKLELQKLDKKVRRRTRRGGPGGRVWEFLMDEPHRELPGPPTDTQHGQGASRGRGPALESARPAKRRRPHCNCSCLPC